jgi:putative hydrolase of the HAD superfamily
MRNSIKVIGFDADDTLWVNEPNYQETEKEFCRILEHYQEESETSKELFRTEMQNLEISGFGAKGFLLSMIETAIRVTNGTITSDEIGSVIGIGKSLLDKPVILLDGVESVLQKLQPDYRLILATKGDLLDQERKLEKSGLAKYFHHIEIMSDKQENNYRKLLARLDIQPHEFLMVGNSVKSDVLPVLAIGAKAIHVPFEVTWQHEKIHTSTGNQDFITLGRLTDILGML